jgi:uncharacterized membrane protein YhaH (DUF805 family)/uncharacterized protein YndB with AHSA1/START domain
MKTIRLLFGMQERINRRSYLFWGIALFILKYGGDAFLLYISSGNVLTPLDFLSPLIKFRSPWGSVQEDWFLPLMVLWTLPFVWVGVGMSIRRAADAGLSPWLGNLFFVPFINYFLMIGLALAPSSKAKTWNVQRTKLAEARVGFPFVSVIISAAIGTAAIWFCTNFLKMYGASLFVGVPLTLGLAQGYFLNREAPVSRLKTIGLVSLTIILIHAFLLLFALEGAICLGMSLPICLPLTIIGSLLGAGIAAHGRPSSVSHMAFLLILPVIPVVENATMISNADMVLSSVTINAPPEKVWPNVVRFPELDPTDDWLFKLGVSYPIRARIEGDGIGAVRYCEFSTGPFVEPITAWEPPHRLAFNVTKQPEPMRELSFHSRVDAPHLNGYFRSQKGEFRLVATADGKTILEGRTWYETDIHPGWYWQLYGRWFIHKIHLRVLEHIKELSEMAV